MKSVESQNAGGTGNDGRENGEQWSILNPERDREDFFSEAASAERMAPYLDSIESSEFMSIIRGYRKHLDYYRQRFSEEQFKEKYDNNPDLLGIYAFASLVKDYLSSKMKLPRLDLEIKQKDDYCDTRNGCVNFREGKIYIDCYQWGRTLGDIAKTMAHEMWHVEQALSSFEIREDGSLVKKNPYFDALFKNYHGHRSGNFDDYYNQYVEREARAFADAFERKIFSDNSSYVVWMWKSRGDFPPEYYARLATDDYWTDYKYDYQYDQY